MKTCKICGRELRAKGLCSNHYSQLKRYGKCCSLPLRPDRLSKKRCQIKECNREHYQYNYCRNHFTNFIRTGNPLGKLHKCLVENCTRLTKFKYCFLHSRRISKHRSLDLSIHYYPKGRKNFMWKGGIAEYPNHYLMKKQRLIVLKRHPICQKCKKRKSTQVHHRNGNKSDHRIKNLMASCQSCNSSIRFTPNNTKNYQKYGVSLYEIASKLNYSYTRIWQWEKGGILESIIKSNPRILSVDKLSKV